MIESNVDITFNDNYLLKYALSIGDKDSCESIISKVIKSDKRDSLDLKMIVKPMIEHNIDISFGNSCLLTYAADREDIELVNLLLSHLPVSDDDNLALTVASMKGSLDIVKLLVEYGRVDPNYDDNYALKQAISRSHTEVVDFLSLYIRNYGDAYKFLDFCFDLGFIPSEDFRNELTNKFSKIELFCLRPLIDASFEHIVSSFSITDILSDVPPYEFRYKNFQVVLRCQDMNIDRLEKVSIQQKTLEDVSKLMK